MDFWKLYVVALTAILKILFIASNGAFLALNSIDILSQHARKHLNCMVYFVFTPALLCSSLARTITYRNLVVLWFLPLNVLLRYIIGTALGWLLARISRVPHHLHGLVMGCCASGNLATLPLIIVPAVCNEGSHPFGNVDVCNRNGLAYASLTMALGQIFTWSIVYHIVCMYSPKTNTVKVDESTVSKETTPENLSKCSTRALAPAEDKSLPNDRIDQLEIECKATDGQEKVPEKPNIMKQLKILAGKINLKALFSPTLLGVNIGLLIGVVPQFRKLLVGDNAPLRVVQDSLVMLGDASVPAMVLLVGANLLKGLKGLGRQLPLVAGIIVVSYIALPAIGIGIVKGAVHFGLIHPDPLYQFVLLLHFALPPAISVSTMTQMVGVGESECSVIMFATYSSAAVLLTLWCTIFMWLVL